MVRCSTLTAVPRDAIINQSSVYLCERSDATDMIPAGMLGPVTAVITLDGPLAPLNSLCANHARVFGAIRAGIDNSTCITTEEEQKQDGVSVMSVCVVVVCFGVLYCSELSCYVCDCLWVCGV